MSANSSDEESESAVPVQPARVGCWVAAGTLSFVVGVAALFISSFVSLDSSFAARPYVMTSYVFFLVGFYCFMALLVGKLLWRMKPGWQRTLLQIAVPLFVALAIVGLFL